MSRPERIRVLHVDDDPEFADTAATFLERENDRFSIETATTVDDGLGRLSGDRFDCVISDYNMPGQNGIEFLKTVREQCPELPFLLYTGKGSEEIASDAISAGVTDYLQKGRGTDQYTVLANRVQNAVERRVAEQARNRQLDAIETAQEGISILDEDGRYIYLNQAFADLHGYDPEKMLGEPWSLAYKNEDVPEVQEDILPEVEQTGYWHGETTSLQADGSTVVVDHTLAKTDQGELVCTVRDVSEQKEREERLRHSTARLEALFENSPAMISVHDTDGSLIEPNSHLCEKTGYDRAELTGMKFWELNREIDPDEAHALWERIEVGDRRRLEGTYQCRDGSTFPVEIYSSRLRFEGDDQFISIARDISEHRERKRDLERYRQIIEDLNHIAMVIDPDGAISDVSPSVRRVLGYEPEELIGENGFGYQSLEAGKKIADAIERVLDAPDEPAIVQTKFRHADGSWCWVESTLRNRLDDESIDGILVSSREITDRVH